MNQLKKASPLFFYLFYLFYLFALLGLPALAHDFWIEPQPFETKAPSLLPVYLLVGEDFKGERIIPPARLISSFELVMDEQRQPLLQGLKKDMAGMTPIRQEGIAILAYRGNHSFITLEGQAFNKHLALEGLDQVLAQRRELGQLELPGREAYSRCAKALVQVGDAQADPAYAKRVDHLLELVPTSNPFRRKPAQPMTFELYFKDQPLPGALVVLLNSRDPEKNRTARTNDEGKVAFTMEGEGPWLVKTVHMIPFEDKSQADWESIWASLSFKSREDNE